MIDRNWEVWSDSSTPLKTLLSKKEAIEITDKYFSKGVTDVYAENHITGSIYIPESKDRTKLPIEFFERDGHVWVVCTIETCQRSPHKFVAKNTNINGRIINDALIHAVTHIEAGI